MTYVSYLFLLIMSSQLVISTNEEFGISAHFRAMGDDLIQSFNKFMKNLKHFFDFPIKKIESKGLKLKVAFLNFFKEIVKDDNEPTMAQSKYSKYSEEENLESILSASQLILLHGYKSESHNILTSDGYILTVHRILPSLNQSKIFSKVALLHHGLLGSSADWLLLGPKKALPYLLVEAGYDVWLANARGNTYSRAHMTKTVESIDFWDFSWHEIGLFDLSAVIEYIRLITDGKSEIHYIGHSMGATVLLVLLSTLPQYNLVLKSAIFLSPLVYMFKVEGPLRRISEFYSKDGNDALRFLGNGEFRPDGRFPPELIKNVCKGDRKLCQNPWLFIANGGHEISDEKLKINILSHVPAGGSIKTIVHYIQLIESGQFQMYDLGTTYNYKKYGLQSPPMYCLNNVTVPVAIFSSDDDWLSTPSDIRNLLPRLQNLVYNHIIRKKGFTHTDLVWGKDASHLLYYLVIDVLRRTATNS